MYGIHLLFQKTVYGISFRIVGIPTLDDRSVEVDGIG
jgi:hypothetical protein